MENEILSYFPHNYIGTCVELGACDGIFHSKTLFLEKRGWKSLCIEPNPTWHKQLAKNRTLYQTYAVAAENKDNQPFRIYSDGLIPGKSGIGEAGASSLHPDECVIKHSSGAKFYREILVTVRTLDFCLLEAGFTQLDFISLDVEGGELEVLMGCSLNSLWQPYLIIAEDWHQDGVVCKYLTSCGYKLDRRLGVDNFYVKS